MNITMNTTALKMSRWMKALQLTTAVLIGLSAQGSLAQTTTLLNFDSIADEVPVTNQYAAQGVLVNGATAINALYLGFNATSGTQVAYAATGQMSFSLSIADVKTVSAYITGPQDIGIYAFDASDSLVGQALLPANSPANTLLSVTSSGPAITRVEIHNGGASFAVDDLSFTTAAPVPQDPICYTKGKSLYDAIAAIPLSSYAKKTAAKDRERLLKEVKYFEQLRASDAANWKLSLAIEVIKADVKNSIKSTATSSILSILNELTLLIKNNQC